MKPTSRRLLALLIVTLPMTPAPAAVDDLMLDRSLGLPFQLRWDNVAAPADGYWMSGVRPGREVRRDLHHVELRPGEDIFLRIPAGEQLRIEGAKVLAADALTFSRSNGSGLEQVLTATRTAAPTSLLVRGDADGVSLIRVRRPAAADSPLRVALFISRRTPPDPLVRYSDLLAPSAPRAMVQYGFLVAPEPYWALEAGTPVILPPTRSKRVMVEFRALYPPHVDAREQSVDLDIEGGPTPLRQLVDTVSEVARPVWVDGRAAVVSRLERVYFDLPAADGPFRLRSSVPVLVRILSEVPDDYLLPGINKPRLLEKPVANRPAQAFVRAEQAARQAWRGGAVRESGLVAAAGLERSAGDLTVYPDVENSLQQFGQQTGHFRDLLPASRADGGEAQLAYYIPPRLRGIGEFPRPLSGAAQHHAALRATLAHGRFLPVGGPPSAPAEPPPAMQEVRLALGGDVLFDLARDTLRPEALQAIREVVAPLGTAEGVIEVIGHTDGRAGVAYNQDLSERRAERVVGALIDAGVAPGRLRALGRGLHEPRATNDTAEGRQANRRVEFRFYTRPAARPAPAIIPRYELPARFAPSILRLAVHAPEAVSARSAAGVQTLFLQYDEEAPQRLEILSPPTLPAGSFDDATGALALRVEAALWPTTGGSTRSGPFALSAPPGAQITAGVVELPLPAAVRSVRLWRAAPEAPPLYAALQYRAAKPWVLPEAARPLPSVAAEAPPSDRPPAASSPAAGDAGSALLSRLLDAARRAWVATLAPAPERGVTVPDDGGRKAAERAAASLEPLLDLEAMAGDTSLSAGDRSWLQNELLLRLGEESLALQRWRQSAWYAVTPGERTMARDRLDRHYRARQDVEARIQLHAAALAQGDREAAVPLGEALLDADEADLARQVLLSMPVAERPVELLLAAAYGSRWWRLFDDTLPRYPDSARRAYWQAYRAQATGGEALPAFDAADAEGRALAAHLRAGERLQAAPARDPAAVRAAWGQWAADHPGPQVWRDAGFLAVEPLGAVTLYSMERDRYGSAFTASAERPLRVRFEGPRTLRIDARPLHDPARNETLEGWLRIRSAEGLWVEPITDNRPADALEARMTPAARPGRAVRKEIFFGPGWHELSIDGESLPILLQLSQRAPLRPLVLRPVPGDSAGYSVSPEASIVHAMPGVARLGWCGDCTAVVSPGQERLGLIGVVSPGAWQGRETLGPLRPAEAAAPSLQAIPVLAGLLARNEGAELLKRSPEAATVRDESVALLWLAEHSPEKREAALARVLDGAQRFPETPQLAAVVDRLSRQSGWVALPAVRRSAGKQRVLIDHRLPESPALRVRHALLPPLADNERRLSGEGQLLIAFDNPQRSHLVIHLLGEELALPPGPPLKVRVQLGERPATEVDVAAGGAPVSVPLDIPAGRHTLRIGITDPLANQFLRIGLEEPGAPPMEGERAYHVATAETAIETELAGPAWLRIDTLRDGRTLSTYRYLDQAWQTVRLPVADGQRETLYRLFLRRQEPDRPVTRPRYVAVTPQPLPEPVPVADRPMENDPVKLVDGLPLGGQEAGTWTLAAGWARRPHLDDRPQAQLVRDEFLELSARYRKHEADTREYGSVELLGRLREQGGPTLGLRSDWSGPLGASPIGFSLDGSAFMQRPETADAPAPLPGALADQESAALPGRARARIEGSVLVSASLHLQRTIGLRTWHLPRATAFAGWQSLDGNLRVSSEAANGFYDNYLSGSGLMGRSDFLRRHARYDARGLDQDVFSAYRVDHGYGWRLGDTLVHQPWRDTLWYAGASVTSNADLRLWKPDHARFELGWHQLLGPLRLQVEYQATHYASDRDRAQATTLHAIEFSLLGESWRSRHQRNELAVLAGYDLTRQSGSIHFVWRMDFGNGRGFRDYRPGDVDFRDLREARLPTTDNNRIDGYGPR